MRDTIKTLAAAVSRLAVIEERQQSSGQSIERAFAEIAKGVVANDGLDKRLRIIEQTQPINNLTNGLIQKIGYLVISAAVGAVLAAVLSKPAPVAIYPQAQLPATQQAPLPAKP